MGDCTGCPYAPTYEEYCNGLSDCPDAYTDKARLCNRNMTNEEEIQNAIEWIKSLRDRWNDKDNVKYCNMAIKALEQKEPNKCGDCISRQAVIDRINKLIEVEKKQGTDDWGYGRERVNAYEAMLNFVKSEYLYPSVEPERKPGKWIRGEAYPHHIYCSECYKTFIPNDELRDWANGNLPRKYCPNCGAKMEVDDVSMVESDTGQV